MDRGHFWEFLSELKIDRSTACHVRKAVSHTNLIERRGMPEKVVSYSCMSHMQISFSSDLVHKKCSRAGCRMRVKF